MEPKFSIGDEISSIKGKQLPSNRQVLGFLLYTNIIQRNISTSARITYFEIIHFYQNGGITIKSENACINHIISLYTAYNTIKKNLNSKSDTQINRRIAFTENLDNLFNIAVDNALELITDEAQRRFFQGQLEKGRPSEMPGIDVKPAKTSDPKTPDPKTPKCRTSDSEFGGVKRKTRRVGRDNNLLTPSNLSDALKAVLTPRTTRTRTKTTVDKTEADSPTKSNCTRQSLTIPLKELVREFKVLGGQIEKYGDLFKRRMLYY